MRHRAEKRRPCRSPSQSGTTAGSEGRQLNSWILLIICKLEQLGIPRIRPGGRMGVEGRLARLLGTTGPPPQEEGLVSPANPEGLVLFSSQQQEAAESSKLVGQSTFARKTHFCTTWFCELGKFIQLLWAAVSSSN